MGHSDVGGVGGSSNAAKQDPAYNIRGALLTSIVGDYGKYDGEPVNKLVPKDKSEAAFIRCMVEVYQVDAAVVKDALEGKTPDAAKFQKMQKAWVKGAAVTMWPKLDLDGAAKSKPAPAKEAPVPSGAPKNDKPTDVKPPADANAPPGNDLKSMTDWAKNKYDDLSKSLPPDLVTKYNLKGLYDTFTGKSGGGEAQFVAFYKACIGAQQEAKNGPPKKDAAPPKAVDAAPPAAPAAPSLPAKEGNADNLESKYLLSASEPGGGGNGFVLTFHGMKDLDAAAKEKEFNQVVASLYGIKESDVPAYCAANQVLGRAHDKWLTPRDDASDFRLTFPQKLQGANSPAGAAPNAPAGAPAAPDAPAPLAKLPALSPDLSTKEGRAKLTEVERQRATAPQLAALGVQTKDGDFLTTRAYVYGVQELVGVGVPDGLWGPETQAKVDEYLAKNKGDTSKFKPACDKALVKAQAQEREMRSAINAALDQAVANGDADHSTWWSKDPRATSNNEAERAAFRQDVYNYIAKRMQHAKPGETWQSITDGVLKGTDDGVGEIYGKHVVDKQSTGALRAQAKQLITKSHDGRPWQKSGPNKYTQEDYDKAIQAKTEELAKSDLSDKEKADKLAEFAAQELERHVDTDWKTDDANRQQGNAQNKTYWNSSDVGNRIRGGLENGNRPTDAQSKELDEAIANLEGQINMWKGTNGDVPTKVDAQGKTVPDEGHVRDRSDALWKLGELYAIRYRSKGSGVPVPADLRNSKSFAEGYNKTIVQGPGLQVTMPVPADDNAIPERYKQGRG